MSIRSLIYSFFVKALLPFRIALRFEIKREFGFLERKLDRVRSDILAVDKRLRAQDLTVAVHELARFDSAQYIIDNMIKASAFDTQRDVMELMIFLALMIM